MASPAPAWRIKSRPCPFYQQGRCLFSDSCNFVHTASVYRPQADQTLPPLQPLQVNTSPGPITPSLASARSPPRSPRTAGLLAALKGVIADDPDEILDDETNKIPSPTLPTPSVSTESTNIVLTASNSHNIVTPIISGIDTNQDTQPLDGKSPPFVQPKDARPRPVIRTIQSSPTEPGQENISPAKSADLLSPVDSVNLNLRTFSFNFGTPRTPPSLEDEVIDSGFAETFSPIPSKRPTSAPSAPTSPLRATFGVLSSPFASPASRVVSPRLSAFIGNPPLNQDDPVSDISLDSPTDRYSRDIDIQGSEEYVVVDDSFDDEVSFTAQSASPSVVAGEDGHAPQLNEEDEQDGEDILPQDIGSTYVEDVVASQSERVEADVLPAVALTSAALPSDVNERPRTPQRLSPLAPSLVPSSISRSSSQDEEAEPLSFNDLFVSTAAMESQTTVDIESENDDSPLGLIHADYSDSPHSVDEGRQLDSPCREDAQDASPDLPPMPSPFSPEPPPAVLRRESSPVPDDFKIEQSFRKAFTSPTSPSPATSPALAFDQESSNAHEQLSLDHSVSVFSPATPAEQVLPGLRSSPSMAFDNFFTREDDEVRPEEQHIAMRDFNEALSPFPSPPLSQAKTPSPVPPVQQQLRPIPAPSESSMSMSALSPPSGLQPGSSRSVALRSVPTPDSLIPGVAPSDPLASASKKVPFGFRNSVRVSKRFSKPIAPSRPVSILQAPPPTSRSERQSPPEEATSPTNADRTGLRPLRLSLAAGPFSAPSYNTSFPANVSRNSIQTRSRRESLASLSSSHVSLHNRLLSFSRTSIIPDSRNNANVSTEDFASPISSYSVARLKNFDDPRTAPLSHSASWLHPVEEGPSPIEDSFGDQVHGGQERPPSFPEQEVLDQVSPLSSPFPIGPPRSAPVPPVHRPPMYAIGTPKPTLLFAIASDDVNQVRQVLESGDVNPNETIGPQSALEFALTNDQLTNKTEIVKTLLAFGADPKALHGRRTPPPRSSGSSSPVKVASPPKALMEAIDPATRYYVERADASSTRRTSALIHRSFFRPLTRVRYELIGQDRAIEELFKVLSIHSRQLSTTPIVVLLCGPSGHGKSLLARKFGALLDVPTHTVNMTALDSTQDLWRSYSMSPYETPSMCTLAEFLINNEGKRCVVVLDEIEKTRDEKTLWSLLMPWELGRCTFEANGRPVDCRNVVWLGTSNVGHDLVLEHHQARSQPDSPVTREEYVDLMGLLRPRVSQRLGASILSRVTSVLPFVPFSEGEKRAICYEALQSQGGDLIRTLSREAVGSMVDGAVVQYIADEGARSLYRAVSNQLLDIL